MRRLRTATPLMRVEKIWRNSVRFSRGEKSGADGRRREKRKKKN